MVMPMQMIEFFDAWARELRSGVSADHVLSSMTHALADRLFYDLAAYDPGAVEIAAILEKSADDRRNPMLSLGEEIALILNTSRYDEIVHAVGNIPSYRETIEEFNGSDDRPDIGMLAGDVLVEEAMEIVRETWASRRNGPVATI